MRRVLSVQRPNRYAGPTRSDHKLLQTPKPDKQSAIIGTGTPACLTIAGGPAGCLSILTPRAKPCSAAFSPRSCRSSCPQSEQLVSQESHLLASGLASTAVHYSATLKAIALLPGLLLEPGVRIELTTS